MCCKELVGQSNAQTVGWHSQSVVEHLRCENWESFQPHAKASFIVREARWDRGTTPDIG